MVGNLEAESCAKRVGFFPVWKESTRRYILVSVLQSLVRISLIMRNVSDFFVSLDEESMP